VNRRDYSDEKVEKFSIEQQNILPKVEATTPVLTYVSGDQTTLTFNVELGS
jgi:hypothetical protein